MTETCHVMWQGQEKKSSREFFKAIKTPGKSILKEIYKKGFGRFQNLCTSSLMDTSFWIKNYLIGLPGGPVAKLCAHNAVAQGWNP